MVKSLDESMGRVLAHLKQRGLEQNTLVIFTSDNGGYIGVDKRAGQTAPVTSNAPLRSGKGSLYEGGVRVPLIVRWPGVTPRGATCAEPVVVMDLFHTLRAAGAPASGPARSTPDKDQRAGSESGAPTDGLDLTPLLRNPAARLDRDALFFHYPHYYETTTPVSAVRAGQWKLLEYLEDNRVELFNLAADPAEKTDIAAQQPARARELQQRLHAWRDSVGAAMPKPNPEFKAKR
jgi:arylsulfatase A-like enzyme